MEKTINQQLDEIFSTLESTYQEYNKAPDSFNVFDAFRIKRSELAWSAWIAYLLDPSEKHGMGNIFLKLFLKQLGLPEDFVEKAKKNEPTVERAIGPIDKDYENGGRIDIIIHDPDSNNALIIENKIDADDQRKQLYRYYNFAHKEGRFNESRIYYLSLLKSYPGLDSITGNNKSIGVGGVLQKGKDKDFDCISYIDDIKKWLNQCVDKCDDSNPIKSIIEQSIKALDSMCHQTVVDAEFRKKVEDVLNRGGKKTIAEKLEFLKKAKFEQYPKCAKQLYSLIRIYQREEFDEMISSRLTSLKQIKTEGKTEGYWSSTAHFDQESRVQFIQIMHDWKPDGTGQLICTVDCKNPPMISRLKKVDGYWPKDSIVNRLNWSFALDDFEGLYTTLDQILTGVCETL